MPEGGALKAQEEGRSDIEGDHLHSGPKLQPRVRTFNAGMSGHHLSQRALHRLKHEFGKPRR
ncbi:hypothetical protein ACC771_05510, partial [Rhizobium ruizarguesonis]